MNKRVKLACCLLACVLSVTSCQANNLKDNDSIYAITTTTTIALPWEVSETTSPVKQDASSTSLINSTLDAAPLLAPSYGGYVFIDAPSLKAAFTPALSMKDILLNTNKKYYSYDIRFKSEDDLLRDVIGDDLLGVFNSYVVGTFGANVLVNITSDETVAMRNLSYIVDADGTAYLFCDTEYSNDGLQPVTMSVTESTNLEDYAVVSFPFAIKGRMATFYAMCAALGKDCEALTAGTLRVSSATSIIDRLNVCIKRQAVNVKLPEDVEVDYDNFAENTFLYMPECVDFPHSVEYVLTNSDVIPLWKSEHYWEERLSNGSVVAWDDGLLYCLGQIVSVDYTDPFALDNFYTYLGDNIADIMETAHFYTDLDDTWAVSDLDIFNVRVYGNGDMTLDFKITWGTADSDEEAVTRLGFRYGNAIETWAFIVSSVSLPESMTKSADTTEIAVTESPAES